MFACTEGAFENRPLDQTVTARRQSEEQSASERERTKKDDEGEIRGSAKINKRNIDLSFSLKS